MVRWRTVLEGVSVRVDCILLESLREGNACNTPSSRLQTLNHSTCTDYPTAFGERKRDKAPRTFKNTCTVQHVSAKTFLVSVFSSKVLTFFFSHFSSGRLRDRKLTRIFLGEARISTYNIISTCRLSSKRSFIVIRLPTTIRNIVGRKKRMSFHSHVPDRLILQSLEFYFTLLVETARVHFMLRRYGSSGIITVRL